MNRRATLNRIHGLVWKQISSVWVAAVFTLMASVANTAPSGGQITAGAGSIAQTGVTTTITQQGQHLAIDWQSFGIAANEAVRFNQPNAASVALNRVLGQDPSQIFGSLSANGQVFILNPNGVLFGSTAQVNVGGLVASTLGLSNAGFIAGNYRFSNNANQASIINQGTLTAADGGYIALLAPEARNEGAITATLGTVLLAAGNQTTLNLNNGSLLSYSIDQGALNALAENKQLIRADGGQVIMTAKAADALSTSVVNNTGIIEARTIRNQGGVIRLEGGAQGVASVSGSLDAAGRNAGETGGTIVVLGDKVALFNGAQLDASGDAGGGTVLIGGNFQGKGPEQNASATFVAQGAQIDTDALASGNGGKVIVWADKATRFYGAISAQGGAQGGNGGFAEVSGKQNLTFAGSGNLGAPAGKSGTLLLDPDDLYVGVDPANGALPDASSPFQAIDHINNYYVLASSLSGDFNYTFQASHDVIFNADVMFGSAAGKTVSVIATNNIQSTGFNVATSGGKLTLLGATMALGAINTNGGLLTINNTGAVSQSGIFSGSGGLTKLGVGTLTLSQLNTYTGATTINAGVLSTNTLANGGVASGIGQSSNAATNLVLDGGTLQYTGGTASTDRNVTLSTAGRESFIDVAGGASNLTISGVIDDGFNNSPLTKIGNGTLTLSGANTYIGLTTVSAGTLAYGANDVIDSFGLGGAVTVSGGTLDIGAFSDTVGTVTLSNGGSITGTGGVLTGTSYAVESGTVSAILGGSGALTKTTSGTVTLSGANTYTGTTTNNAGTLVVGADAPSGAAGALGNAASAVLLGDTAGTANAALLTGGAFTVGRAISVRSGSSGTVTLGGNTADSSTFSGNVTLGKDAILAAAGSGTAIFSGVISGANSLTKTGAGTVVLSNTNTFGGAGKTVNINAGRLSIAADSNLGDAANALTFDAGTLLTTTGVASARAVTLNAGGGTFDTSTFNSTLSGVLGGAGGLTKTSNGTLTLSGANTYQGATTVSMGTLTLQGGAAIADTGAVDVASGATLNLGAGETISALTSAGTISGTGITLTAATYGFTGGTIDANLGTGTLNQTSGSTALNGTVGATTVNINGGTLTLGAANRLADTAALTVNGGTFSLGGFSDTVGAAVLQAGTIQNGTLTGSSYGMQDGTVSAILAGSGIALNKTTTGIVTLSGANTYTGLTTVSAGTLNLNTTGNNALAGNLTVSGGSAVLQRADQIANTANVAVSGGALNVAGFNDTVNGVQLTGGSISGTTGVLTSITAFDMQNGTVGAVLGGAAGLSKTTGGTVTLSGANQYTGLTDITAGALAYGANNVISSGAVTVNGATAVLALGLNQSDTVGTVTVAGGGSITGTGSSTLTSTGSFEMQNGSVSAILAGSGIALNKTGAGIVTLSGANTYSGLTTVSNGTLFLNTAGSNALAGNLTVSGGSAELQRADQIADTANVLVSGGTLNVAGFNDTMHGVQLTGGTISGSTGVLTSTTAFDMQAGTVGAILGGGVGLSKTTGGTVTLSGANTYTGSTTASGGTLALQGGAAILDTAGTLAVASGAILNLSGADETISALTSAGTLTGAQTLTAATYGFTGGTVNLNLGTGTLNQTSGSTTLNGTAGAATVNINGGTLTLGAANRLADTAALTVNGGTFSLGGFSDTVGAVVLQAGTIQNGTLTGSSYGMQDGTVSAILAGSGIALNKTTNGTVTLSGANTYTGATTISGGVLSVATIGNGGVAGNLGQATNLAANLVLGGGTLQYTGANDSTDRNFILTTGTTSSFDVTANNLTMAGASTNTTGALTKLGNGTLTLSGANLYTGLTTVSAGNLTLAGGAAIVDAGVVNLGTSGASLTLSAGETIGSLAGVTGTNVNLGATTLTTGGNNSSTAYAGVIGGAGGILTKTGAGTFTLSGANTYSGGTTVTGGTLTGTTTSLQGAITDNATLVFDQAGAGTYAGVIGGSGTVTKLSAGNVTFSGSSTYNGGTTVAGGTLTLGHATNTLADTGAITVNGGTLDIGGNSDTVGVVTLSSGAITGTTGVLASNGSFEMQSGSVSAILAGSGIALNKTTGNTVTLSGANQYTGLTTVSAGTLKLGAAGDATNTPLGTTAAGTSVTSGAVLDLNGFTLGTAEALTLNGTGISSGGALTNSSATAAAYSGPVTLGSASSIAAGSGKALSTSGTIDGAYALDVLGGGTVTLGGTVGSGTALASFSGAAGTALTVNGGLVRTSGAQTYSGATIFGGATTLTAGSVSAPGAVTATAGTLTLATGAGDATLTNTGNDFSTVAATSGNNVSLVDANALTIAGINATGLVDVRTQTGDLTLNTAAIATTSTSANAVTLVAGAVSTPDTTGTGGNLKNAGNVAITTGGAWRIYTGNPTGTTRGGLAEAGKRYNVDDGSDPLASGNRIYFRIQPALTLTADNKTKTYGDANAFTYSSSGLIDGDSIGAAISSGPGYSVDGSTSTSGQLTAGTPHNITPGAASSSLGYSLSYASGTLTVNQKALTITTAGVNKVYDGLLGASATYADDRVAGDVLSIAGSAAFTGKNVGSGKTVNVTGIGVTGTDAGNYTFNTTATASAAITARALSVAANAAAITYTGVAYVGGNGVTYTGFVNSETPAVLSGILAYGGTSQGAINPGSYVITPNGLISGNYAITYLDGVLTVNYGTPTQAVATLAGGANLIPAYTAALVAAIAPVNLAVVPSATSPSQTATPVMAVQTGNNAVTTGQVTLVNGGVNIPPDLKSADE
ncbi:MAG TPA: autotransporter-associated beta strand repeat-containing protein [Gallionella sp.]|nr:autotransporter-associated beta strand repeat-containing protein [Gallionella sp.]